MRGPKDIGIVELVCDFTLKKRKKRRDSLKHWMWTLEQNIAFLYWGGCVYWISFICSIAYCYWW